MNNPNKSGLSDLAVLVSRRTFGINRVSRLAKSVKGNGRLKFKSILFNIQLWVVSVLIICSILSLFVAWDQDYSVKYRTICNLVCVFVAYVGSFFAFSYIRQHTNKKANDQVNINDSPVQVLRNGAQKTITLSDVVVNDIVVLEEGSIVPADGILLRSAGIRVDESTVGGNNDVYKRVGAIPNSNNVYPSDWMIGGSIVFEGNGTMKVTRVGNQTEYGRSTAVETSNVDSRVPYVFLVDVVSRKVSFYILLYSLLVLIVCYVTGSADTLYSILTIPTNFIVAVLPIIVPYAIAMITHLANKRIAKMGVKVKNMNTPYALGMTSSIISGRFGLISSGLMNVTKVFVGCASTKDSWLPIQSKKVSQDVISLFYKALSLSTSASIKDADNASKRHISGAAEESAIVRWLYENHVDVHQYRQEDVVIDRILSMRESGLCAVMVEGETENYVFVQGRPKEVFSLCRYVQCETGKIEIDEYIRLIYKAAKSESPYLVSVAYARVPSSVKKIGSLESLETFRMSLLGLVYIDDSIREGVKEFVYSMRNSHIDVRIITSLRKESAVLLASKAYVINEYEATHTTSDDSVCLTSEEIKSRNQGRLPYGVLKKMKVISQVSLSDRIDIVKTLQQNGEIVTLISSEARVEHLRDLVDVSVTMRRAGSETHNGNEVSINRNHLRTLNNAISLGKMLIRNEGRVYSVMMGLSFALVVLNTISMVTCGTAIISIIQMFWLDIVCIGISALAIVYIQNDRSLKKASSLNVYNNFTTKTDFFKLAIVYAVFDFALVFTFWLMSAKMDIVQVSDIWNQTIQFGLPTDSDAQFSVYERTLIMTLIVMCTFWSLVIVRVFDSSESLFYRMRHYWRFYLIALLIPLTHYLLVYFDGGLVMARSENPMDWIYMMGFSSVMLLYVELRQFVKRCYLSRKRKSQKKICRVNN